MTKNYQISVWKDKKEVDGKNKDGVIEKIYKENNENNKSMLIEVTDKDLINKTGGIIQGMSGSPIIQNDKLIGAVTHVLVNEPTKGYGIFIQNMMIPGSKG